MKRLRLSVATARLGGPLKQALLLVSRWGIGGVQFDVRNELRPAELSVTGRRELLHNLEQLGLQVASLHFPSRGALADADHLDARLEALRQVMDFAYQIGARTITARLGSIPGEQEGPARDAMLGVLEDLARLSNRTGVVLALGVGREPVSRVAELLKRVTQGPIGVDLDPASALKRGESSAEQARQYNALIQHVTVRDALLESGGNVREVPLGRGEVAWDELLATLDEVDYRGWLLIDRTQGQDHAGDIGRGVQYLNSVAEG